MLNYSAHITYPPFQIFNPNPQNARFPKFLHINPNPVSTRRFEEGSNVFSRFPGKKREKIHGEQDQRIRRWEDLFERKGPGSMAPKSP
ncbi:hypothetical protein COLO4_07236 [Corchorus olitorius]|uniref:Uncharacterized protein n=1 Tax=Corchorus olitorius TaxID=93759 RepID=A0A1R3KKE4_9ROSI|nr:hypothetical protein COLO4_07236 [Corchorus olitorius]